jgi:hypothetical protein
MTQILAGDVFLLAADERPQLVQFQTAGANADEHPVMQFGRTTAHAGAKAHDCVAVNAGQAFDGADAHALGEGGDNFNLLVARKVVHGLDPWLWIGPKRDYGKTAWNPLYKSKWSLLRGSIPGF